MKDAGREYPVGKWHRRDFEGNHGLPLTLARFGDNSFKLVTQSSLGPGEYAFATGQGLYTFAVSAPSSASAQGK